jgi:flagellar motor switch protein FliM
VTGNLTPEEARALSQAFAAGEAQAPRAAQVESRQFDRPQRLPATELAELRERLRKALPEIARELSPAMRGVPLMELVELAEVHAETVTHGLVEPFAALRFEVERQPGWLVWDCKSALATLDVALGAAEPADGSPRTFTNIERGMFPRMLAPMLARLAKLFGLGTANLSSVQAFDSIGHWRQGGDKCEPQRLCVTLAIEGPGGASTLRVFLPGVMPAARPAPRAEKAAPLPTHLAEVEIELHARLGDSDVPLAQLLALEVGDVIPLGLAAGGELEVLVEDQPRLRATLGRKDEHLALRITSTERPKREA